MKLEEIYSRKIASVALGPVVLVGWFNPAYWGVGFEFVRFGILIYFGPFMFGVVKL